MLVPVVRSQNGAFGKIARNLEARFHDMPGIVQRQIELVFAQPIDLHDIHHDRCVQSLDVEQGQRAHHADTGARIDTIDAGCGDLQSGGVGIVQLFRGKLVGNLAIAAKMAGLVNDQRVVRHGLFGPAFVLCEISTAVLGDDVQEARSAIVAYDFVAVVVELPAQLVEMTVPHSLRGVLGHQRHMIRADTMSQDSDSAHVPVRPVGKQKRAERKRASLILFKVARKVETVLVEDRAALPFGNRKQARIARFGIGDRNSVIELVGVEALVTDRIVEREEMAPVGKLYGCLQRLQEDAVPVFENSPAWLVSRDRVRENHERHHGIALVVWTFGIIAIW